MEHLHLELTNCFTTFLHCTPNLCEKVYGRGLCFSKDVDVVSCHPFLCNEHLLGSVDDEITPGVVWTLIQVVQVLILKTT